MMTTFIDPGRMRTEVSLEAATAVPDEAGGYDESWTEVAVLFAQVEPVGASARFAAAQMLEDVSHRITMRHRAGVVAGMRFRKGTRLFMIVTVHDPDETGRYLVCLVREQQQ